MVKQYLAMLLLTSTQNFSALINLAKGLFPPGFFTFEVTCEALELIMSFENGKLNIKRNRE